MRAETDTMNLNEAGSAALGAPSLRSSPPRAAAA